MSSCIDHGRTRSIASKGEYALVGRPNKRSRSVGLHRVVYAEANGLELTDIDGMCVRHTCDNTRCINPEHLVLGTIADNNRDRAERGRSAKTVPSRQTLTDAEVEYIRRNYVKGSSSFGLRHFASRYNVHVSYISRLVRGLVR